MLSTDVTLARRRRALELDLAPIRSFLEDDTITEVMRNPDGNVFVDRLSTGMELVDAVMTDAQVESMLRTVGTMVNRSVGPEDPSLQAELEYPRLFRLQGLLRPVVEAPLFSIRKPGVKVLSLDDYEVAGIITAAQSRQIRHAIMAGQNILIGGTTGSGKTTLANAVLGVMSETGERFLTIEDTRELRCSAPNRVCVRVTPGSFRDQHYGFSRAVYDALRLRIDRIIIGEVRDAAALDIVNAWLTGHGGLATVHAGSLAGMPERICQLIQEVVAVAPRALVAETINFLIHVRRDPTRPRVAGTTISLARVRGLAPDGSFVLEHPDDPSSSPHAPRTNNERT